MLLALHQLVVTIQPIQTASVLGALLGALTHEPLLDLALAALLTWVAHYSMAAMLLIASLAAGMSGVNATSMNDVSVNAGPIQVITVKCRLLSTSLRQCFILDRQPFIGRQLITCGRG